MGVIICLFASRLEWAADGLRLTELSQSYIFMETVSYFTATMSL